MINPFRRFSKGYQEQVRSAIDQILRLKTPAEFDQYRETLLGIFGGDFGRNVNLMDQFDLGRQVPKEVRRVFLYALGERYENIGPLNLPKAAEAYQKAGFSDKARGAWRAFFEKAIAGDFDREKVGEGVAPVVSIDDAVQKCNLQRIEARGYLERFNGHLRTVGYGHKQPNLK